MFDTFKSPMLLAGALVFALAPSASFSGAGHSESEAVEATAADAHADDDADAGGGGGHDQHDHGFGTMDELTAAEQEHLDEFMAGVGLVLPNMSSSRGRELFATKGCAVCHSVNGVGGEDAPTLDAADMPGPMNVFEFSARMWRGAPAMVVMQEDELGEFISLTGEELADLVAFAHDGEEQAKLTIDQIPEKFRALLAED